MSQLRAESAVVGKLHGLGARQVCSGVGMGLQVNAKLHIEEACFVHNYTPHPMLVAGTKQCQGVNTHWPLPDWG